MLIKTRDITETGARLNAQVFGQNYKYYKTDEDLFGWSVDAGFDFALGDRGGVAISYRHFENEGQPQEWRTVSARSEEHTSELQSLMRISYAVFCLKKKKNTTRTKKLMK